MFTLRNYQSKAHELIINGFKQSKKLLLVMSTGSGKSKTVISFVKKYEKHYIWILVVRRRDLVTQLENDIKFFNLDYGVFMAGHEKYYPKKEVQIASVDTLVNRDLPHINSKKDIVLIIDEADESNADGFQSIINSYMGRTSARTFLLGMTATPFDDALPHFDEPIVPITANELKSQGSLVEYRYYIPKMVDYSEIKIENGEFRSRDIDRVFNSPKEIQSNFESWQQFGEDRQTLVFCSNQDHAINVKNYFSKFFLSEVMDANTPDEIRKDIYADFKSCKIKFLINIRLVTRGVDIPEIGCILDLAPTIRVNNHIQKLGRGSRPNDLYGDCIIIDAANNCVNNGHFYKDREINLKGREKKKRVLGEELRICKDCFRGADPLEFGPKNTCPFCGFSNGRIKKAKVSKKTFLENASIEQIEQLEMINYFKQCLWKRTNLGRQYPKDIAREFAINDVINKYGIGKVEKIKKSIGMKG